MPSRQVAEASKTRFFLLENGDRPCQYYNYITARYINIAQAIFPTFFFNQIFEPKKSFDEAQQEQVVENETLVQGP